MNRCERFERCLTLTIENRRHGMAAHSKGDGLNRSHLHGQRWEHPHMNLCKKETQLAENLLQYQFDYYWHYY